MNGVSPPMPINTRCPVLGTSRDCLALRPAFGKWRGLNNFGLCLVRLVDLTGALEPKSQCCQCVVVGLPILLGTGPLSLDWKSLWFGTSFNTTADTVVQEGNAPNELEIIGCFCVLWHGHIAIVPTVRRDGRDRKNNEMRTSETDTVKNVWSSSPLRGKGNSPIRCLRHGEPTRCRSCVSARDWIPQLRCQQRRW